MRIKLKDPYIQENGTLKNKLGIKEYDELNRAERDIGFVKLIDIGETFKQKYDKEYLKTVHKHIFEDIFDWAGEFRTVPIEKVEVVIPGLSVQYSEPKNIERDLDKIFSELNDISWQGKSVDQIVPVFTNKLAKLWRVHPFRDGNTRTTLAFAEIYSRENGFPMDIGMLLDNLSRKTNEQGKITRFSIRDKFVLASLDKKDYPEPEHLEALIKRAIQMGIKKEQENQNKMLNNKEAVREGYEEAER